MQVHRAPVIGITTYGQNERGQFHLYGNYVEAVRQAGGLPVLLPPGETLIETVFGFIDGLMLTGGGDISPDCYQGDGHPTIDRVDLERDAFELALAKRSLNDSLPVLGICRGLQILSVASGSSLVPHVPDTFGLSVIHRHEPPSPTRHAITVLPDTRLADIVEVAEMEIVSWHHQAVSTPPLGWVPSAYAADGLVEAMEYAQHPWAIAVQWHPEMSAADDPLQQKLFKAFVAAAMNASQRPVLSR